MPKKLVKAAKFNAKNAAKTITKAIEDMQVELTNIAITIDEAEENTPYKLDRISIDNVISRVDKDLENLDKYCQIIFRNYKTEL